MAAAEVISTRRSARWLPPAALSPSHIAGRPRLTRFHRRTKFTAFRLPMLIRIVRMTFRPDAVDKFLALFDASSPYIRRFDGCRHLELWQDTAQSNVCTTYSLWTGEEALDAYRRSDFFISTWGAAKSLFASPPEAASHTQIRLIDAADAS